MMDGQPEGLNLYLALVERLCDVMPRSFGDGVARRRFARLLVDAAQDHDLRAINALRAELQTHADHLTRPEELERQRRFERALLGMR